MYKTTFVKMFRSDTHITLTQPGPEPPKGASCMTRTQLLASLAVSLGSMIVGYSSAWSSPAIASLMEPGSGIQVTQNEASWIGSLMPLAALAGGFTGGPLLESFGRKKTIMATALPFIGASLLVSYANGVEMIYAGRAITGFCIGMISLSLPVYLAEAIHPEVRGTLGLLPTSLGNGGVMLCYVCGFFLNWSQLSLVGAIIPLPFLLLMCMIPETPRYLLNKGKDRECQAALQWLRGDKQDIARELHDMERTNILMKKTKLRASELFQPCHVKPLMISIGLMFFQQFSGINAVMFYSVSIFELAGSSINSNLATIILGVVNIGATIFSNAFIDKLGRKILLYISDVGMIISLVVFGGYFYLKEVAHTEAPGWIPLLALMVYVVSFSVGFGPIPWLMMGEIFPSRIRGAAASLSTAFNWACTFIVTKTFMDLQGIFGPHGVFWMFAVILVFCLAFIIFFVPETRGQTLEDIERLYTGQVMDSHLASSGSRRISSLANLKPTPSIIL
eukprot:TCALIF_05947-PA protein Name:"Similar to Tret1 Facilitated trehalose transporter Tret1 (Culex quinquefasciatus)" AED:0.06 eAED:0.06 QI:0/0.66/0.5/0.75/0.66/0.75/4/97/504